ncbi:excisionase family DNA-binding protein [Spirillospora sp. CA-128828]|uniref:excisionase family DNA-binding protein n=1 Tax=Spirillospora sp. CA-128828 TaxID=3240033 RepID=UPI003D9131C4
MTALNPEGRILTYDQAAEVLNTTPRFPRRPVEERRIRFVKVGDHAGGADRPEKDRPPPTTFATSGTPWRPPRAQVSMS